MVMGQTVPHGTVSQPHELCSRKSNTALILCWAGQQEQHCVPVPGQVLLSASYLLYLLKQYQKFIHFRKEYREGLKKKDLKKLFSKSASNFEVHIPRVFPQDLSRCFAKADVCGWFPVHKAMHIKHYSTKINKVTVCSSHSDKHSLHWTKDKPISCFDVFKHFPLSSPK